jgi:hypothetical protein
MRFIDFPAVGRSPRRDLRHAFSVGEISCTDQGALARFEKVFQFRPGAVVAASEDYYSRVRPDDVLSAEARMDALFLELLPKCYAKDALPMWTTFMIFEIKGVGSYGIRIEDGTCKVVKGEIGEADATVQLSADTFSALVRHWVLSAAEKVSSGIAEHNLFGPVLESEIQDLTAGQIQQVAGGWEGGGGCAADAGCAPQACSSYSGTAGGCAAQACYQNGCSAAACAAEACGLDSCAGAVCAGEACAIAGCYAEACVGNGCFIDACPINGCVGDTCPTINVFPGIPGINHLGT